jgi:hypothetical protein
MRDEMLVKLDAAFDKLVDAMTASLRGKPVQKTPPRPSWFGRLLCRLGRHRWSRGGLNAAGDTLYDHQVCGRCPAWRNMIHAKNGISFIGAHGADDAEWQATQAELQAIEDRWTDRWAEADRRLRELQAKVPARSQRSLPS